MSRRIAELLATYPPGSRTPLEIELLAELERATDAALGGAAAICDELAAGVHARDMREEGLVAAQLASAIRSRKSSAIRSRKSR